MRTESLTTLPNLDIFTTSEVSEQVSKELTETAGITSYQHVVSFAKRMAYLRLMDERAIDNCPLRA